MDWYIVLFKTTREGQFKGKGENTNASEVKGLSLSLALSLSLCFMYTNILVINLELTSLVKGSNLICASVCLSNN
jgi:hypothetical protein